MCTKTIAIIGAGPSGLATLKSVLKYPNLHPTIFDLLPSIGGLWSPHSTIVPLNLITNISKFNCAFSDYPWEDEVPIFPDKNNVFLYLEKFKKSFLEDDRVKWKLGHEISKVKRIDRGRWHLEWRPSTFLSQLTTTQSISTNSTIHDAIFDYLIICTGIFSNPYIPRITGLPSSSVEIYHSSSLAAPDTFQFKNVAVVGSSFSSTEVISSLQPYAEKIHHIIPHPFYVLPRYIPLDVTIPGESDWFPTDLVLNRWSRRSGLHEDYNPSKEKNVKATGFFLRLCGTALGGEVDVEKRPYVTISDTYSGFVRDKSSKITLQPGKLVAYEDGALRLSSNVTIPGVDSIIFATGFAPNLEAFLPPDVLNILSYDPKDLFQPLLLHRTMVHPDLPTLGCVGLYRGPYFGVLEMQSKYVVDLICGKIMWPEKDIIDDGIRREKEIRERGRRGDRGPFPHSDWVGMMNDLALDMGMSLPKQATVHNERDLTDDFITPSHYQSSSSTPLSLTNFLATYESGRFVAHRIFHSLTGTWSLHRTFKSNVQSYPSGTLTGLASFTPIPNSSNLEYLYSEEGIFTTSNGFRSTARRKYIYKYESELDRIDVYFVKPDGSDEVDYFFHSLRFEKGTKGWVARGDHLCVKDQYDAFYEFAWDGVVLEWLRIRFLVEGPEKDYIADATYRR